MTDELGFYNAVAGSGLRSQAIDALMELFQRVVKLEQAAVIKIDPSAKKEEATHKDRVEAVLSIMPKTTTGPWVSEEDRIYTREDDPWLLAYIETTGPNPDADLALLTAAPDLVEEILLLRAQLEKTQQRAIDNGVNNLIEMSRVKNELNEVKAELAEMKRWRDPTTEPPKESGYYLCRRVRKHEIFYYDKEKNTWGLYMDCRRWPDGWMPLPEVGE